jgi:RNA polymerase-binding transcription factor DksA
MDTHTYKTKLEEEMKILITELSSMGKNIDPEREEWEAVPEKMEEMEADENDLADRFEDYEKNSEEVRALEARLREVHSALKKIEAGTYGTCEVCHARIEDDRLTANPGARTCKEHMNA